VTGVQTCALPISNVLPSDFILRQNFPNPFNSTTAIEFRLSARSHVKIKVVNLLGETVRMLIDQDNPAGTYRVIWDGTNDAGKSVSTGFYLYRLQAGNTSLTKKMLLLK
jgi:flagellar hook assembly protein FlgD